MIRYLSHADTDQSFADDYDPEDDEDEDGLDDDDDDEEEDSDDGLASAGSSAGRDASQGEEEVSNTLVEVPLGPGPGRGGQDGSVGQGNHIAAARPGGPTGPAVPAWDTQSVDLEQSESGWTVYRSPEGNGPVPVPPPMVATSDDGAFRPDDLPPLVEEAPSSPPTSNSGSAAAPTVNTSRLRPCDKRVDLYVLQPERLNSSGAANPLKGKLTNCHATGCER